MRWNYNGLLITSEKKNVENSLSISRFFDVNFFCRHFHLVFFFCWSIRRARVCMCARAIANKSNLQRLSSVTQFFPSSFFRFGVCHFFLMFLARIGLILRTIIQFVCSSVPLDHTNTMICVCDLQCSNYVFIRLFFMFVTLWLRRRRHRQQQKLCALPPFESTFICFVLFLSIFGMFSPLSPLMNFRLSLSLLLSCRFLRHRQYFICFTKFHFVLILFIFFILSLLFLRIF